jgi:hypothetical protein
MSELYDRGFLRSLRLEDTIYMLATASGLSDELDTEGGLVRVRLIVGSRFMLGGICMWRLCRGVHRVRSVLSW